MADILKIVGMAFAALIAFPFILLILVLLMVLFLVPWALGVPFTVKEHGKVIGHIRWAKFTRI